MRILILGGDGYLGWPTAMRFSNRGHEVHVVDNYLRRARTREAGTDSLTPIRRGPPRARRGLEGRDRQGDRRTPRATCATGPSPRRVFREFRPEAVVHYGEMPSAPRTR